MKQSALLQRFSRYLTVGLIVNVTLYLVFLLMIWLRLAPPLASGLCYVMGVTGSYLLNRNWSFSSTAAQSSDIIKYLGAYGFGLIVTVSSIWMLSPILGPAIAQLATIGIATVAIYSMLELLRFGR